MSKKTWIFITGLFLFLFSCAPAGLYLNHSNTEVQLSKPNFKIVAKNVTGTSSAEYLLGISYSYGIVTNTLALYRLNGGGMLYKEAMENLWKNFEKQNGSAIGRKLGLVNVRYDSDVLNLLLYTKVTITIQADVVEFE